MTGWRKANRELIERSFNGTDFLKIVPAQFRDFWPRIRKSSRAVCNKASLWLLSCQTGNRSVHPRARLDHDANVDCVTIETCQNRRLGGRAKAQREKARARVLSPFLFPSYGRSVMVAVAESTPAVPCPAAASA